MRSVRVAALTGCLVAGALAAAIGARAVSERPVSAAALLAGARQMLLVTTADWNGVTGTLQAFERASATASWTAVGTPVPIVVGRSGTAWDPGLVAPVPGPVKAEGDGRSPAGVFALGRAFGFAPAADARWLKLPYGEVTPTLECVDDPASGQYNMLVDRATAEGSWKSSEKMRKVTPGYHWGVVVEYNTRPIVPQRGSCIFLHIGGQGGKGTAGCTAMAEPALRTLLRWLDPKAAPVLVQLPLAAHEALRAAWGLPAAPAATR
jgi:D-alanyl-D-alanine dipeptidase